MLADGTIGEVRSAHLTMAMQFLDPADIRNSPELGGGSLYDMGGYVISACRMLFGREPDRVIAAVDRDPETGVDRLSTAILDYGGAHAAITVSIRSGPAGRGSHQLLSVLGSTGWLRLDYPLAHANGDRVPPAHRRRHQLTAPSRPRPSPSSRSTSTPCRRSGSPGSCWASRSGPGRSRTR